MAVQAQYPSHVLFPSRNEKERKNMENSLQVHAAGFLDQSALFFSIPSNGGNANNRKRGREASAAATMTPLHLQQQQHHHPIDLFSLQQPPSQQPSAPLPPALTAAANTTLIDLSLLHTQPQPATFVSTGLRLSFEGDQQIQQQHQQQQTNFISSPSSSPLLSSIINEELAAQIKLQKDEIDHFLQAQGEQLRRTLAEARRMHYRALLGMAEESAARRLREKEAEVARAARRNAELEEWVARLRAESMAWQAKARADEATAVSLQAQLQQAAEEHQHHHWNMRDEAGCSGGAEEQAPAAAAAAAEDAESAYVDPERREERAGGGGGRGPAACMACRRREVGAVLLPCRHLCVCRECGAGVEACPVCLCARSACVEVFLSPSP